MSAERSSLRDEMLAFTAAGTLTERTDAFVSLVRSTRHRSDGDTRLNAVLDLLDEPDERRRFHAAIGALLVEAESRSRTRGFPASADSWRNSASGS
jgi:hypothetical protein